MIMAYARLAMACPRIGYKIEQQGFLQPQQQMAQMKLPLQSSSARHFLQTAQTLCKQFKDDVNKLKECSVGEKGKPTECSEDEKGKPTECSNDADSKSKECTNDEDSKSKECSKDKDGKPKECSEQEGNIPKDCSDDEGGKPKECSEDDGKSKECSEQEDATPKDCSENEGDAPQQCSEDDDDKPKECPGAPKMPCCEDPKSVCVDPCDDEEMDEIAAHVGGKCAKDPCGKLRDPSEVFIKKHIGRPKEPNDANQQEPIAKSKPIK